MNEAPDTPEMKALAAFLHASFSNGMNGAAMREAVDWSIGRDLAAAPAEPVVTTEMVAAYLAANTAYWQDVDKMPSDPSRKWRQGTPSDATRVGLIAALAAANAPPSQQSSRLSGLHISKEWLTAKLAEGDDSNCQVGQPQQAGVADDAARVALHEWAVSRWRDEVQHRPLVNIHRRSLDDAWRQVIRFAGGDPDAVVGPRHDELLAAAPPPQRPAPALGEAEFLSKRLARVAELAGVPMPDMSHEDIAGVAGTILGSIARSLEGRTLHGQRLHFTPDGVQTEPATLVLPPASPKGQP